MGDTAATIDKKTKKRKKTEVETEEANNNNNDTSSNSAATTTVTEAKTSTIFSDKTFDSLPISDKTKDALRKLGFERMTQIQAKSIPECLTGV